MSTTKQSKELARIDALLARVRCISQRIRQLEVDVADYRRNREPPTLFTPCPSLRYTGERKQSA